MWWVGIIIVIILIVAVIAYARNSAKPITTEPSTTAQTQNIQAIFACDNARTITAVFMNVSTATTTGNSVQLTLSDGRQMILPQALSADGARYASTDENTVFWNVGNAATLTENGSTTFDNCVDENSQ